MNETTYPPDWPQIARRIKDAADWRCERCRHPWRHYMVMPCDDQCTHPPDLAEHRVLTVHHLDGNKANVADWNLAALCQRCHLHIQAKVSFDQGFLFEHSDWFQPHLDGYLASLASADGSF